MAELPAFSISMSPLMADDSTSRPEITIEQLVELYYEDALHLALTILDNIDEAHDAAQDAFVAANRSLSSFRGDSSPKTWIFSIVINQSRGVLRKRKRRARLQEALGTMKMIFGQADTAEAQIATSIRNEALWQAVDELPETHRLPVLLKYAHDCSGKEIAQMLNISEGTVHSRLHHARKQLRSLLTFPSREGNL